jgi:argonaute-like protein implicated in RNA metabolism and viral defense
MDEILERLSIAEKQLNGVRNKVALRDLQKMIKNIDSVVKEISKESVECRRLKKDTVRYNDLKTSAVILLDNLDHHIIFAMLLS